MQKPIDDSYSTLHEEKASKDPLPTAQYSVVSVLIRSHLEAGMEDFTRPQASNNPLLPLQNHNLS